LSAEQHLARIEVFNSLAVTAPQIEVDRLRYDRRHNMSGKWAGLGADERVDGGVGMRASHGCRTIQVGGSLQLKHFLISFTNYL